MGCPQPLRILAVTGREAFARPDGEDSIRCRDRAASALSAMGYSVEKMDVTPDDMADPGALGRKILGRRCHCVLNFFEGFGGSSYEEVSFAALLDGIGIPFTGNGSSSLGACLDKEEVRSVLRSAGIPVPPGLSVRSAEEIDPTSFVFPLFIKPTEEDGSVGIGPGSLVRDEKELRTSLEQKLKEFPRGVTVESFIDGPEYAVAFIGDYPYRHLAVSVIDYGRFPGLPPYLGYDSKWDRQSPEFSISPTLGDLDREREEKIVEMARAAGKALKCRGPFRVDMREKDGEFFVLDVNPNPDLNDDSGFIRQCLARGIDLPNLMDGLVRSALTRRLAAMARGTGAFSHEEISVLEEVLESWREKPDGDYSLLTEEEDGVILGFVLFGRTPMTEFAWDLYWIVVDNKRQGKGIGRRLVGKMENAALERGKRAVVRVETSGKDAYEYQRRFYSSTGFEETGRIRDFYSEGDDLVVYCRYAEREAIRR